MTRLLVFIGARAWSGAAFHDRILVGDAPGYHQLAVNLLAGHGFSMSTVAPFVPDALRTPGYPLFLALVYGVIGISPPAVLLAQVFVGAATCAVVAALASRLWNRRAGLLCGTLLALEPASVMAANQLLSETWFTFLLVLSVASLLARRSRTGLAGALMGGAILVRPVALYLAGLSCLAVAILAAPGRRLRTASTYAAACLLLLAPWLARNAAVFGTPQLSSFQGENLFVYNAGMLQAGLEHRPFDVAEAFGVANDARSDPFEHSQALTRAALRTIWSHPLSYVRLHLIGTAATLLAPGSHQLFSLFGDRRVPVPVVSTVGASSLRLVTGLREGKSSSQLLYIAIATCFLVVTYLLAIRGLWLMLPQRAGLALVIVLMVAFLALAPGPQGEARFRVPLMPLVALAAGAAARRRTADAE